MWLLLHNLAPQIPEIKSNNKKKIYLLFLVPFNESVFPFLFTFSNKIVKKEWIKFKKRTKHVRCKAYKIKAAFLQL